MKLLEDIIRKHLGEDAFLIKHKLIGGGCINHGALVETDQGNFFVKWSQHELDMFEAEEGNDE